MLQIDSDEIADSGGPSSSESSDLADEYAHDGMENAIFPRFQRKSEATEIHKQDFYSQE